jgi:hypothetical protein
MMQTCVRCRRYLTLKKSKELGMCEYCRKFTGSTKRLEREKAEEEERRRLEELENE